MTVTLLAAVVVTLAAPAGAEDRERLEATFRTWDQNGDGQLTRDEWRGRVPFERADRNGDGAVSLDEVVGETADRAEPTPPAEAVRSQAEDAWTRLVQVWDGDRDGRLSTSEWQGRTPHASFDSDGDGLVTGEEFVSAMTKSEPSGVETPGLTWERALRSWDTDGDGQLSASEWKGRLAIDKLDADGNGQLTETELKAVLSSAPEGGGGAPRPGLEATSAPAAPSGDFELMLRAMDSNRDGQVSKGEWNGGASDWATYDANRDGLITAEEVP